MWQLALASALFCVAIWDTHLQSVIDITTPSYAPEHEPLAKRIVLFVVDGLRNDVAWEVMPFVAEQAQREDAFRAISMTQAPSESRACHTAMLAGFWEDLANLRRGWHGPLQPFDHVLRGATRAWAWGGEDVVDFFPGERVKLASFPHYRYGLVDNVAELDQWSVERFQATLQSGKGKGDDDELRLEGNLFFLHLSGVDTAGHRYDSTSTLYRQAAADADRWMKRAHDLAEDYFGHDGQTLYVFTADHGFPDVGGHGGDEPSTLTTPFLAWGRPIFTNSAAAAAAVVMEQRQIAPLLATILAKPIPTNNDALLRVDLLKVPEQQKALMQGAYVGQQVNKARQASWRLSRKNWLYALLAHLPPLLLLKLKPAAAPMLFEAIEMARRLPIYLAMVTIALSLIAMRQPGLQPLANHKIAVFFGLVGGFAGSSPLSVAHFALAGYLASLAFKRVDKVASLEWTIPVAAISFCLSLYWRPLLLLGAIIIAHPDPLQLLCWALQIPSALSTSTWCLLALPAGVGLICYALYDRKRTPWPLVTFVLAVALRVGSQWVPLLGIPLAACLIVAAVLALLNRDPDSFVLLALVFVTLLDDLRALLPAFAMCAFLLLSSRPPDALLFCALSVALQPGLPLQQFAKPDRAFQGPLCSGLPELWYIVVRAVSRIILLGSYFAVLARKGQNLTSISLLPLIALLQLWRIDGVGSWAHIVFTMVRFWICAALPLALLPLSALCWRLLFKAEEFCPV